MRPVLAESPKPDRRKADNSIQGRMHDSTSTVEISTAMRLGDMTLSRSRSVDHLVRQRNGRILSASSEDTLRVYRSE